jgi:hypothetical protein
MAANFEFWEANGAGQTLSSGITNVNWKNIDDTTTAYTAAPITAGSNSFEKWQFGFFHGTYNTISNGFFDHTSGVLGTGLTISGMASMTTSGLALVYTTPSTTKNANLTKDYTSVNASFPTSAPIVMFGPSGPDKTYAKQASTTANPAYTNYLTTQLLTSASAGAGDTATVTFTLRYDES